MEHLFTRGSLITEFATKKSHPAIAQFVGKRLKTFTNAKMNKICDLVSEFGSELREELLECISEEVKDAVDSIVSNRHEIAHGRDVSIGFPMIRQYYASAVEAVEEIEKRFKS